MTLNELSLETPFGTWPNLIAAILFAVAAYRLIGPFVADPSGRFVIVGLTFTGVISLAASHAVVALLSVPALILATLVAQRLAEPHDAEEHAPETAARPAHYVGLARKHAARA
jgi:hypothetical protein